MTPLYSYLRHWLTLQAIKLVHAAGLPEEGAVLAVDYLVEALMLVPLWFAVKYVGPLMKRLRAETGHGPIKMLHVFLLLVASGLLSSCGGIAPRVTADGCLLGRMELREGHVVEVGICEDGRKIMEWQTRQGRCLRRLGATRREFFGNVRRQVGTFLGRLDRRAARWREQIRHQPRDEADPQAAAEPS